MKYVLQEELINKFILAEDVLVENTNQDLVNQLTTILTNIITNIGKLDNGSAVVNEINKRIADCREKLANNPDVNDKSTLANIFAGSIKDALTNLDSQWQTKYKSLKQVLNANYGNQKSDTEKLLTALSSEVEKMNTDSALDQDILNLMKTTSTACENRIKKFKDVNSRDDDEETRKLIVNDNAIKNVEALRQLSKKITKDASETDLTDTCTKINEILGITETAESDGTDKTDNSNKADEDVDWAERLRKAPGQSERQQIWDEYFEKEWGENADRVRKLGKALIIELNHLGFNEKANPFISFIENNIVTGVLNLNETSYGAIHNAYTKDYITSNDLRNPDPILKCQKMYEGRSGGEVEEYLQRRHEIINKSVGEMIDGYEAQNINLVAIKLFNKAYQLEEPDKDNPVDLDSGVSTSMVIKEINSISIIRDNIRIVFGEVKQAKIKLDDPWFENFEKQAGNDIKMWAKAAICYILLTGTINNIIDETDLEKYKTNFKNISEKEMSDLCSINSAYYKKMIKIFKNANIAASNIDNLLNKFYSYTDKKAAD